jgi:hypothetical protein
MTIGDLITTVERSSRRGFFHFTDTRNIPSIRTHGLLSLKRLQDEGLKPITGGNDWSLDADRRRGLDGYVHLCFHRSHQMEYAARERGGIDKSVFLRVAPEVLRIKGVLMSLDVSNQSGVKCLPPDDAIPQLDLDVLYKKLDWRDIEIRKRLKAAQRYEILVPDHVPVDLIHFPHG